MAKTIEVLDAIMSAGKTTAIIDWMDNNPQEKFIYVSPNLSEVDVRIPTSTKLDFVSPKVDEYNPTKLEHLNQLLLEGRHICCTHKLYLSMTTYSMDLIESRGYTVILDEEINVMQSYKDYSFKDVKWLLKEGYINHNLTDGSVEWVKDDELLNSADHRYFYCKNLCDKKALYLTRFDKDSEKAKQVMMVTQIPIRLLECAKRVVVVSYLFKGSVLDKFLQLKGFKTKPFTDVCVVKKSPKDFKHLLTIVPPEDLDDCNLTSYWWTHKSTENKGLLRVQNYILRNARKYGGDAKYVCWTAPKERSKGVSTASKKAKLIDPIGYVYSKEYEIIDGEEVYVGKKPCWLSAHTRATNDYAHKKVMIHCYNRYPLQDVASYLQDYGHKIDDDVFALSELVQWCWRGQVRSSLPMTICIGSKRMYELFMNWLNELPLNNKDYSKWEN